MIKNEAGDIAFNDSELFYTLLSAPAEVLDALSFGVIGFNQEEKICIYNTPEARWAGLEQAGTIGSPMFEVVAPCMNNYLVAERFKEALANRETLDVQLDYVLTLRMRPTRCTLRLLSDPISNIRFILVNRK